MMFGPWPLALSIALLRPLVHISPPKGAICEARACPCCRPGPSELHGGNAPGPTGGNWDKQDEKAPPTQAVALAQCGRRGVESMHPSRMADPKAQSRLHPLLGLLLFLGHVRPFLALFSWGVSTPRNLHQVPSYLRRQREHAAPVGQAYQPERQVATLHIAVKRFR